MLKFKIGIILLFCIITANSFILDKSTRTKRSDEDSIFNKFKSGVANFASDVKKLTNKGVEEVKNLFSRDRNVGDYRIDQIDVRFGDDDLQNASTTSAIESQNQIDEDQTQRDKREINEEIFEHTMGEFSKNLDEQLGGSAYPTEGIEILISYFLIGDTKLKFQINSRLERVSNLLAYI